MTVEQAIAAATRDAIRAEMADQMERLVGSILAVRPVAYTKRQAGLALGVSDRTIGRLIAEGLLPTVPHVGDRCLIPVAAVEAFASGSAA